MVDWACRQQPSTLQRKKVIPRADGDLLEIGVGSGLNLPIYDGRKVRHLTAIDPSREMWDLGSIDTRSLPFDFDFVEAYAEDIPANNDTFDTVVMTYTLCTIPDTERAMEEVRKMLKPGGRLLFCEHGEAPDGAVRRWQQLINPAWKRLGRGCHLNKPIPTIIGSAGFRVSEIKHMYIPGWKPVSYDYWGSAISR